MEGKQTRPERPGSTAITVRAELYAEAPDRNTSEHRSQRYVNGTGLERVEHRSLQRESDWSNADFERHSTDNGRTWGEWQDVHRQACEVKGDDEVNTYRGEEAYNPVHGHFVSVGMRRVFFGGHTKAYELYWGRGEAQFFDHSLLVVRKDRSDERSIELVKYEGGADYDPNDWRNPAYVDHNRSYFGGKADVLDNGEILFTVAADVRACCRILGLDIEEVFPSCPDIMRGMIVVRGVLVRETLTTIDTRREGDSPELQLSNFHILEDRETGLIELYLSKIGQREGAIWWADCWRYFIDVTGETAAR